MPLVHHLQRLLAACLRAICSDPETRLLPRVKNRLAQDYDILRLAWYRDEALNLRLVGCEAVAMGLETHVCEMRLLLLNMYELKILCTWREVEWALSGGGGYGGRKIISIQVMPVLCLPRGSPRARASVIIGLLVGTS